MTKRTGTKKSKPGKSKSGAGASGRGVSSKGGSRKGASSRRPSTLREQLERAADGLNFSSESDYPYRFFSLPAEGENDLTPQGFLMRLGLTQPSIDDFSLPVDKLVEERTLDGFFPSAEDLADASGTDTSDPKVMAEAKRFQKLEAVLRKNLKGVKVLRVGTVEIRCYIAGLDKHGDITGLVTTAIET